MQLFPLPPVFLQNAGISRVYMETEGDQTVSIIRAEALHPIAVNDELYFEGYVYEFGQQLSVYHGDALVGTVDNDGQFTRDHVAVSNSPYLEYRSEGEGQLIIMSWPSITRA